MIRGPRDRGVTVVDDIDEWWVLGADHGRSCLQVQSAWIGRTGPADFRLPDGRDEDDLVSVGDFAAAPYALWFEPLLGGVLMGDMIAAAGAGYKIVSQRLIDTLDELDVVGFLTTPADLRTRAGSPIRGYHLLHALPPSRGHEVRPFLGDHPHVWLFEVSTRVHDELVRRGVVQLQSRRARVAHDSARRLVSDPAALSAIDAP
jgi:hypothetical protein